MSPRPGHLPSASDRTDPAFLLDFAAPVTPRPRQPPLCLHAKAFKFQNASVVVGALRWAAVWSEVKEEGRIDLIRSERIVNRPGGHERNTAARRSAHALTSIDLICLQANYQETRHE